ncbi:MAG: SDR family NAD(P)-dependent oxidoreductase [Pirellula sp.]|jgi:3-oxoacyl-[acyl-carrier protein] reductase
MHNPMELVGRRILVTGGSSGIGRETSILLSRLGAELVIVGRNPERLEATRSRLEGGPHHVEEIDLSDTIKIPDWLKSVSKEVGTFHGLVHSAGTQLTKPLRVTSHDEIEDMMRINIVAALSLVKGFRQKGVVDSQGGSVVFLSSVMGLVGQAGQATYSATKGALVSLTKTLAMELAREKIRVNSVAPAMVRTEMMDTMFQSLLPEQVAAIVSMHPLGIGTPEDVANAIAFLLADTGRWITGTTLVIDGGYTAH